MSAHGAVGGWRRDQLWLTVMGVEPLEQTLEVVGVRDGSELLGRALQDLADATAAYTAGDTYTAEAVTAALAVAIRAQRKGAAA